MEKNKQLVEMNTVKIPKTDSLSYKKLSVTRLFIYTDFKKSYNFSSTSITSFTC
jgi:hypothetical protein